MLVPLPLPLLKPWTALACRAVCATQLAAKKSIALPYTTTDLDTGLAGDFGFDPLGLASAESKCE